MAASQEPRCSWLSVGVGEITRPCCQSGPTNCWPAPNRPNRSELCSGRPPARYIRLKVMDELVSLDGPAEDFDRLAAVLRADSGDLSTFLEVVASKFESALPGRTKVEREGGGMLRRHRQVRRVSLELGDLRFELARSGGAVVARCTRVVRGIALKTELLNLDAWLVELARALSAQAGASSQDRVALERLLT